MTAYELSAKIDFKDVSSFTNALRRMRIEANKGTKSVADMGRAIDKLSTSTKKLNQAQNNASAGNTKTRREIEKLIKELQGREKAEDKAAKAANKAIEQQIKLLEARARAEDKAAKAAAKAAADRAKASKKTIDDLIAQNTEVNRLRDRYRGASGSLNRFTDSLRANSSANSLFLKAIGLSYRDISKFNKIIALASNRTALFSLALIGATVGALKGAKALGAYSRELAAVAAIGNTTTTTVQGILNAIRPFNGTILEAGNAVEEFNERLGDLTATGGGPAKQAYQLLNLAVRDVNGNLREAPAVLNDAIKGLRGVASESQQAALTVQLFGEQSGPILSAALRENSDAFNDMEKAAKGASNVLSEDVVRAANKAFTALETTRNIIRVTFFDAVSSLSPRLERFAELLVRLSPTVEFFGTVISGLAHVALNLVDVLLTAGIAIQDFLIGTAEFFYLDVIAEKFIQAADAALRFRDAILGIPSEVSEVGPIGDLSRIPVKQNTGIADAAKEEKDRLDRLNRLLSESDDIEKTLQGIYSRTNQLRLEGIDDVITREKVRAKLAESANAEELDRLSYLEVDPTKKFEAVIAFNNLEIAQQEKIARLEKTRNESNKERINLFESSLRGELLSQNVENSDGSTLKAFEARKSALNEYLQYQIEKEYEALDKLLIETKASNGKRLELERDLGKKISSDRLALSKQIAEEELEIEKKLIDEKRSLSNILQRQDNNLFAGSKDKEAGFIKQAEYQRESLKRQIEQDREALNIQLENFERHESEKAAIRATFEAEAAQRQSNLNIKLEADSRAALKTLLEPATGFFEELAVGYAKSKNDGEQSWKAVRDAAVKNLQEILLQQIINQGIQSALSFGLGLFGGAAGAATGGIGAISPAGAQGGGVTSFPTTNNSAPLFNASTRSKPMQNDYISADVKVEINGNNQNPAEVEAAALAGAEKALNSIVDKRIAYQSKTNGLIGRSRR